MPEDVYPGPPSGPFGVLDAWLRTVPARHDLRLRRGARADKAAGIIRFSGAFLARPAAERRAVLAREAARLNGQAGPGGIIAGVWAAHWTSPVLLAAAAPSLVPAVREEAAACGLPLPPALWQANAEASLAVLPPAPGTAPVPDGRIRLWHVTPLRNAASVRERGLLLECARGDAGNGDLSDPSAGVWASTRRPGVLDDHGSGAAVAEFHASPADLSRNADHYWGQDPFCWARGYHHVIMNGDVPPEQIAAVHEPWQAAARSMLADDPSLESYRWVLEDPDPQLGPYRRGLAAVTGAAGQRILPRARASPHAAARRHPGLPGSPSCGISPGGPRSGREPGR